MVSPVRVLSLALLCLGVAGILGTGVGAGLSDGNGASIETQPPSEQFAGSTPSVAASAQDIGRENGTNWYVEVKANGDSRWRIVAWFNITSDTDQVAFEELAGSFAAGDDPQLGLPEFESAVERVDDETDRDMALVEEERVSGVDGEGVNRTGRLELRFTWKNFARVEDDGIHIDEAGLTADGAVWLRGLAAGQTLEITPPEGYSVFDATVAPEDGALRWVGPVAFDAETLQATFTGEGRDDGNGTDGPDDPNGSDDDASLWPIGVALAILVLAIAVVLITQRERLRRGMEGVTPAKSEPDSDEAPDRRETPGSTEAAQSTEESVAGSEADQAAEPAGAAAGESDNGVDLELLSDEERVEHLLESNGGRMKQASIVTETDWSNAKVSQLLSSMEEEGRIDKLRIGRENLISFPDQDIGDIDDE